MSKLSLDLRVGETVTFNGGEVRITLEKKSGQLARLRIEADESTTITTPRQRKGDAKIERTSAPQQP